MRFYKIYKCKTENIRICKYLEELASEGRLAKAPGALGLYFSADRFNPDKGGHLPEECNPWEMQPIMDIKRCGNDIVGDLHKPTMSFHVTGVHRCQNRLCMFCNTYASYKRWSRVQWMIDSGKIDLSSQKLFFVTFTLPNQPDGFRDTYDILKRCVYKTLPALFWEPHTSSRHFCTGLFGNFEVTHKLQGWHPHLHMICSYNKSDVEDLQTTLSGKVKKLVIKGRSTSLLDLKNRFYNVLSSEFPDYVLDYDNKAGFSGALKRYLQVDFRPVTDNEEAFLEVCKYMLKSGEIRDKEDLWVWIRDGYRISNGIAKGIFRWSDDYLEQYYADSDLRKAKNKNFVYFGEDAPVCDAITPPGYVPAGEVVQDVVLKWRKGAYHIAYFDKLTQKYYIDFDDDPYSFKYDLNTLNKIESKRYIPPRR